MGQLLRREDEEETSHTSRIPWLLSASIFFSFRWVSPFHARNVGNSGCNITSNSLDNSTSKRTPIRSLDCVAVDLFLSGRVEIMTFSTHDIPAWISAILKQTCVCVCVCQEMNICI